MDWTSLIGPAVVAALIAAVVSAFMSERRLRADVLLAEQRFAFDREQAERKAATDKELSERKLMFDRELAERKFIYDREFNDHKRRVELAEKVLVGFLRLRDIVREVRSPFSFYNEGQNRPRMEGETSAQAKTREIFFAPADRLLKYRDFINDLMVNRYQMSAFFGSEANVPFDLVWSVLAKIQSAVRSAMISVSPDGRREGSREFWQQVESAIWADVETPDPLAAEMERAIAAMEAICRPVLSGRKA